MDIQILKTFLEVSKTCHFGKAAENLKITQAGVSLRIKQLEKTLGTPLFNRYRNNLQLTEAGENLTQYAVLMLNVWERACEEALREHDSGSNIRIGALNGFCGILLKQSLSPIYGALPGIRLTVENYQEETMMKRLLERNLDLLLLYHPTKSVDYVSRPVSSVELCFVSTQSGLNLEQALEGKYITVDWGRFLSDRFMQTYINIPRPILKTTDAATALQFMLDMDGGGCAFLPYKLVEKHLGTNLFHIEEAPIFQQPIYAVYRRLSPLAQELETVSGIIEEYAKPSFADMYGVLNNAIPEDLLDIPVIPQDKAIAV